MKKKKSILGILQECSELYNRIEEIAAGIKEERPLCYYELNDAAVDIRMAQLKINKYLFMLEND